MQNSHRFGRLIFNSSFSLARDETGREIRFTRAESGLLKILANNANTLFSRGQLIEKVSPRSESDRYVDYLVTKLRTKLGDDARKPAFIATHHGEGYVWIARSEGNDGRSLHALLVIGPVFGLRHDTLAARRQAILERLCEGIGAVTVCDQRIVIKEDWTYSHNRTSDVRFTLDVSFFSSEAALHCAAALRDGATRKVIDTHRFVVIEPMAPEVIQGIAASIKHAMWVSEATPESLPGPRDVPLELRMHDAAMMLTDQSLTYATIGQELAERRRREPDSPDVMMMWAMHLYMRVLLNPSDFDMREAHEAEISAIVLAHLASYRDHPIHRLAAARLLMLVDPDNLDTAEQLAEQALAETPAFAASFAMLGRVKMYRGYLDEAIHLYDCGIELAEPRSEFHILLLVNKCIALAAEGDRQALEACCSALYEMRPAARFKFGYLFAVEDALPPDLDAMLAQFDLEQYRRSVSYLHYFSARSFLVRRHRENLMRGMIAHAMRKFGAAAVSEEVWRSVPRLREKVRQ